MKKEDLNNMLCKACAKPECQFSCGSGLHESSLEAVRCGNHCNHQYFKTNEWEYMYFPSCDERCANLPPNEKSRHGHRGYFKKVVRIVCGLCGDAKNLE